MNETTAQDASGATIAVCDDLKVDRFFAAHAIARPRGRGRCRTRGRPERAHRSLENRGRFSTSAHRHHQVLITKKNGSAHTWPATGLRQLPSSAAVASGAPLLTLRRQK
jgi:hypothetical protein